jgi:hypothetical protein
MTLSRRDFLIGATVLAGAAACGAVATEGGGKTKTAKAVIEATTTTAAALVVSKPLVGRVKIGLYLNEGSGQSNLIAPATLGAFEATLGKQFDVVHYFVGWNVPFNTLLNANVPKRDLMISWDPPGNVISEIVAGSQDAYLTLFARAAKAYGHPVYLRFAAEMNGDWNSYSSAGGGPSAATFVLAWHRVVGIFKAVKATNVKFIWCPSEVDSPNVAGNHLEEYWPGATYVDLLGFDAYNWGTGGHLRGSGGWRSFDTMCATPYARVGKLAPKLDMWIGETGCPPYATGDPAGVSKGQWFYDMFRSTKYPRLKAVIYFSENDTPLDRDWRINSSPYAAAGWKRGWLS